MYFISTHIPILRVVARLREIMTDLSWSSRLCIFIVLIDTTLTATISTIAQIHYAAVTPGLETPLPAIVLTVDFCISTLMCVIYAVYAENTTMLLSLVSILMCQAAYTTFDYVSDTLHYSTVLKLCLMVLNWLASIAAAVCVRKASGTFGFRRMYRWGTLPHQIDAHTQHQRFVTAVHADVCITVTTLSLILVTLPVEVVSSATLACAITLTIFLWKPMHRIAVLSITAAVLVVVLYISVLAVMSYFFSIHLRRYLEKGNCVGDHVIMAGGNGFLLGGEFIAIMTHLAVLVQAVLYFFLDWNNDQRNALLIQYYGSLTPTFRDSTYSSRQAALTDIDSTHSHPHAVLAVTADTQSDSHVNSTRHRQNSVASSTNNNNNPNYGATMVGGGPSAGGGGRYTITKNDIMNAYSNTPTSPMAYGMGTTPPAGQHRYRSPSFVDAAAAGGGGGGGSPRSLRQIVNARLSQQSLHSRTASGGLFSVPNNNNNNNYHNSVGTTPPIPVCDVLQEESGLIVSASSSSSIAASPQSHTRIE
eukprot:PhM_4_TR3523/c0_g1_i2/m.105232